MLDTAYNSKKVIVISLVALALVATSVTYFYYVANAAKIAHAFTPCPTGKVCGFTPQDGTVLTGNTAITTGKTNSVSDICGVSMPLQSIVIVPAGTSKQAAVLTVAGMLSGENNPGTRIHVEIEYPNDCVDSVTGIAYKGWQGTAY